MSNGAKLIPQKRGLQLDRVVLLGRTFDEYCRYFLLEPEELAGKTVLDVAGGVSSFCAEANTRGIRVTSFDPIYSLTRKTLWSVASRTSIQFTTPLGRCRRIAGIITKAQSTCVNCASERPQSFFRITRRIPSITFQESCQGCPSKIVCLILLWSPTSFSLTRTT